MKGKKQNKENGVDDVCRILLPAVPTIGLIGAIIAYDIIHQNNSSQKYQNTKPSVQEFVGQPPKEEVVYFWTTPIPTTQTASPKYHNK